MYEKLLSWISYAPIGVPRYAGGAFIYEGKIYFIGGKTTTGRPTTAVEVVDIMTLQRSYGEPAPIPIAHFAHAFDGRYFYVIGGLTTGDNFLKKVLRYDPEQNLWTDLGDILPKGIARACFALTDPDTPKGYLMGGVDENGNIIATTYEIDLSTPTVTEKAAMSTARENHACGYLGGYVYVFGGDNGSSIFDTIEKYDPATDTWEQLSSTLPDALTGITATKIKINNKEYILIIGG